MKNRHRLVKIGIASLVFYSFLVCSFKTIAQAKDQPDSLSYILAALKNREEAIDNFQAIFTYSNYFANYEFGKNGTQGGYTDTHEEVTSVTWTKVGTANRIEWNPIIRNVKGVELKSQQKERAKWIVYFDGNLLIRKGFAWRQLENNTETNIPTITVTSQKPIYGAVEKQIQQILLFEFLGIPFSEYLSRPEVKAQVAEENNLENPNLIEVEFLEKNLKVFIKLDSSKGYAPISKDYDRDPVYSKKGFKHEHKIEEFIKVGNSYFPKRVIQKQLLPNGDPLIDRVLILESIELLKDADPESLKIDLSETQTIYTDPSNENLIKEPKNKNP